MVKAQWVRPNLDLSLDSVQTGRFRRMRSFQLDFMQSPDITSLSTPELEKIILVTNEGNLQSMGLTPANPPDDLLSQIIVANTPTPLRSPATMIGSTTIVTHSNQSNNANGMSNFSNNNKDTVDGTMAVQKVQLQNNMHQQQQQSSYKIIQDNHQRQHSNNHIDQQEHLQNRLHHHQNNDTNTGENKDLNQYFTQQPTPIIQENQSLASTCISPQLDILSDEDNDILLKVKRKRERNRFAASKCRQRKVDRIKQLENEVRDRDEQIKKIKEEKYRQQNQIKHVRMISNDLEQENKSLKQEIISLQICQEQS